MTVDLIHTQAYAFAERWHDGQKRKGAKAEPFIQHPLRVTQRLASHGIEDPTVLNAALLHDVIEDTDCSHETIASEFGETVLRIVLEVTDDKALLKSERKQRQVERAEYLSPEASLIRLADKIDNIATLALDPPPNWNWPRRRDYIAWADRVVNRIPDPHPTLLKEFKEVRDNVWAWATGSTEFP
jgi:guanosine-3',5'-bis(diphosphate) 3'-pyrophosphohydrolase